MTFHPIAIEGATDHRVTQVGHAGELDFAVRVLRRQLRPWVRDHPAVVVYDQCNAGFANNQIPQEATHTFELDVDTQHSDQFTAGIPVGL